MGAREKQIARDEVSARGADMAAALLPVAARKKAALRAPDQPGTSFLYEIAPGWQADALRADARVVQVRTPRELAGAMDDVEVGMIMVPGDASVTKAAALQICERHRQSKTIFYERQK